MAKLKKESSFWKDSYGDIDWAKIILICIGVIVLVFLFTVLFAPAVFGAGGEIVGDEAGEQVENEGADKDSLHIEANDAQNVVDTVTVTPNEFVESIPKPITTLENSTPIVAPTAPPPHAPMPSVETESVFNQAITPDMVI